MGYLILIITIIYLFFVPWKIKKNITFGIVILGVLLVLFGLYRVFFVQNKDVNGMPLRDDYAVNSVLYGFLLIIVHFITIFTSRGAWSESKGIEGYNESKRLFLGVCPNCNKKISRTAKVCPHCTSTLF